MFSPASLLDAGGEDRAAKLHVRASLCSSTGEMNPFTEWHVFERTYMER